MNKTFSPTLIAILEKFQYLVENASDMATSVGKANERDIAAVKRTALYQALLEIEEFYKG